MSGETTTPSEAEAPEGARARVPPLTGGPTDEPETYQEDPMTERTKHELATRTKVDVDRRRPITSEGMEITPPDPTAALFELARQGVPTETLERMLALAEKVEDRRAEKELHDAVARFHAKLGPIAKDKTAEVKTKSGSVWSYDYATLGAIDRAIRPILSEEGLSFGWTSELSDKGDAMLVTCTLQHVGGASRSSSFPSPIERIGRISRAQENAVALTYGRRQSLIQVLGLTTADADLDGSTPDTVAEVEPITEAQVDELSELFGKVQLEDRNRMLSWAKAATIAEIPSVKFADVKAALERRVAQYAAQAEKEGASDA